MNSVEDNIVHFFLINLNLALYALKITKVSLYRQSGPKGNRVVYFWIEYQRPKKRRLDG